MSTLAPRYRPVLITAWLALLISHSLGASGAAKGLSDAPSGQEERIHRVEASVAEVPTGQSEPPLTLDLAKLMLLYKVPGLSIAVIDHFEIIWAKAYGVIETGSTVPVSTRTLFQAGSHNIRPYEGQDSGRQIVKTLSDIVQFPTR
jgi:CubicO group peptidase (beta-lactamase class C family)